MLADDTALFVTVDDPTEAAIVLDTDLQSISQWAGQWIVTFSPPKTESMLVSLKHHNIPQSVLKLDGSDISDVSCPRLTFQFTIHIISSFSFPTFLSPFLLLPLPLHSLLYRFHFNFPHFQSESFWFFPSHLIFLPIGFQSLPILSSSFSPPLTFSPLHSSLFYFLYLPCFPLLYCPPPFILFLSYVLLCIFPCLLLLS